MPPSVFRALDAPRPPSPGERRLLVALASAGGAGLVAQVTSCAVVGVCRCGCASVELRSVTPALTSEEVLALSDRGRDDHVAITAAGVDPAGRTVDVVLHVVLGRAAELEVFDRSAGEGHRVDPASLGSLGAPESG